MAYVRKVKKVNETTWERACPSIVCREIFNIYLNPAVPARSTSGPTVDKIGLHVDTLGMGGTDSILQRTGLRHSGLRNEH